MRSIFKVQLVLVLALVTVAGLVLLWDGKIRVDYFQQSLNQQMARSVDALDAELTGKIRRLQDLAVLFSEEQSGLIFKVYVDNDNWLLNKELEAKVKAYFPEYLAFTVSDADGMPVMVDTSGAIGKGCLRDLASYAQSIVKTVYAHTPYIHFNPAGDGYSRHFDVMVPWHSSNHGVFFVSIRDEFLQHSMQAHEMPGYDLLLLRSENLHSVELASDDSVIIEKAKRALSADELHSITFLKPIAGTLWHAAAIPDQSHIDGSIADIKLRNLIIWLVSSLIMGALIALWYLEIRRRRKLSDMNRSLEKEATAREVTENELRKLTNYDPLTTLPNRKSVDEFLERTLAAAKKHNARPAVLFFDIDRFQEFNDTLGHGYGDVLLKEAARRLHGLVAPEDILARWGGDEFVVVMQHIEDEEEAAQLAETLLEAMRKPINLHRHNAVATISIGIATYPDAGEDAETLLKNADLAMYRAKSEGRDQARFFIQEMDDIAHERRRLEQEIRQGIERGEFEPYFQPRMDIKSGKIVGCEALMRWHHPTRGVLAPGAFLDTLERGGLIEQVGDAVRTKVCDYRIKWHHDDLDVGVISINLGGPEFFRHDIVDHLNTAMLRCGLEAKAFEIEITESHVMENTGDSLAKLHALKNLGFSLAVDDFGTGYSSLAYLKRFPVDIVKIDKSFVDGCVTNPEDQDILRAILNLSHGLSLRVVAEGVETIAQLELLRELKCDEVQGYLIARPLPFEEYTEFLLKKNRAGGQGL